MKRLLSAGAAALLLLSAGSALAQPWGGPGPGYGHGGDYGHNGGWDIQRRLDWMFQRVDRGRADGSLSRGEAERVRRELMDIRHDAQRYRYRDRGPRWDQDQAMLEARLDRVSNQIHWMRQNGERRPW